ncbi:hypothetical protein WR25_13052 [Diploscapter pachys]|uniref:Uncharacterized protein n=1 Tax=Diploscapter pachys TaxID=2018661 RepID=A0A2A2JUA9_9BILA|nr:hypothetical protein WR25_13052 [Diploscapter pachys]
MIRDQKKPAGHRENRLKKTGKAREGWRMAAEAANKAVQELKLNVSNFYQDEESRGLIMAEEAAAAFSCTDDDIDYFNNNEKIYEDEDDLIPNDEIVGVINWLHYPVGDMAFRRFNRTHSAMPATVEPHL